MDTWRALFARLWRVLRLRFARQRMCEDCGDALVRVRVLMHHGGGEYVRWECVACAEWREIVAVAEKRARPQRDLAYEGSLLNALCQSHALRQSPNPFSLQMEASLQQSRLPPNTGALGVIGGAFAGAPPLTGMLGLIGGGRRPRRES